MEVPRRNRPIRLIPALLLPLLLAAAAGCSSSTSSPDTSAAPVGTATTTPDAACAPAVDDLEKGLLAETRVDVLKEQTLPVSEAQAFYSSIFQMDPKSSAIPLDGAPAQDTATICVLVGDNFGDIHTPPPNAANPSITFPAPFYTAAQYVVHNGEAKQVTVGFNDTANANATVLVLPREYKPSPTRRPRSRISSRG